MKKKWRNAIIAGGTIGAVVVGAYGLARSTSKYDVLKRCQAAERDASVRLVYVRTRFSLHHGVLVRYRIVGLTELDKAVWYLIPWREVILSK